MPRNYSQRTIKILFAQSGNQCAEPDCNQPVVEAATEQSDDEVIAQIAHIYASSDDGPRGKPDLTEAERDRPSNLLLLCPTHHTIVDKQHESYPAELLVQWKAIHRRKFAHRVQAHVADIGYAELEIVAKRVMTVVPAAGEESLVTIPPDRKIALNDLSPVVGSLLKMGGAKAHEVAQTIIGLAQFDPSAPQRLKSGFQTKYEDFKNEGFWGDDLFFAMLSWASGDGAHADRHAAGLCVLSHLFILCEVFERDK